MPVELSVPPNTVFLLYTVGISGGALAGYPALAALEGAFISSDVLYMDSSYTMFCVSDQQQHSWADMPNMY